MVVVFFSEGLRLIIPQILESPVRGAQPHRVPNGVPATAGKNKAAEMGCNQVETRRNAGKMDRPARLPLNPMGEHHLPNGQLGVYCTLYTPCSNQLFAPLHFRLTLHH